MDCPSMATPEPVDDGLIIGFGDMDVAKDAMVEATLQGLLDERGGTEVHVGDPKGEHLGVVTEVPFYAVGTTAGDDFVKIVIHGVKF